MEHKRNTIQRQVILSAVEELNIHATAEQVVNHLAKSYPTIGRATIYRNLNSLAESGELLRVGTFYGSMHYDHNCHEHFHFVCNKCKQVFDVDGSTSAIREMFNNTEGFDITECNISFSGICWKCKSQ